MKYFKKITHTLFNFGLIVTFKKIKKHLYNHYRRGVFFKIQNYFNWKKIKNKYKGKRVFIIGNGPSLNKTELYLLKNEYTICFNRFSLMFERLNFIPTFYMNTDPIVAENMNDEINLLMDNFELVFIPDIHTNGLDYRRIIDNKSNVFWMQPDFRDFYFNLPNVALGGTVAYSALQVLVFLGFKEIYFIGTDMEYQTKFTGKLVNGVEVQSNKDDDSNHFDPRYFGKKKSYHLPDDSVISNILNSFKYAKKTLNEQTNVIVKNATLGGSFDVFDRCIFKDLFLLTKKEKQSLLIDCINRNTTYDFESYTDLIHDSMVINDIQNIKEASIYLIPIESIEKNIPKVIFDYKIFGPYEGTCFLIKR